MKETICAILQNREHKLCVLATADKAAMPASAALAYAVKDDCTIIVSTHANTQKAKNIAENQQVSMVFGFNFTEPYVQLKGTAKQITDQQEKQAADEFFFSVNPQAAKFKTPDTIFFAITPTWARLMDFAETPPKTEEVTF